MSKIRVGIRLNRELLKELLMYEINDNDDMQAIDLDAPTNKSDADGELDILVTYADDQSADATGVNYLVGKPTSAVVVLDPDAQHLDTFVLNVQRKNFSDPSVETIVLAIHDCFDKRLRINAGLAQP